MSMVEGSGRVPVAQADRVASVVANEPHVAVLDAGLLEADIAARRGYTVLRPRTIVDLHVTYSSPGRKIGHEIGLITLKNGVEATPVGRGISEEGDAFANFELDSDARRSAQSPEERDAEGIRLAKEFAKERQDLMREHNIDTDRVVGLTIKVGVTSPLNTKIAA